MTARKLNLQRIRVDAQGYDAGGAYWGAGPDVFIGTTADGNDEITVRARNATEARRKIAAEIARQPGAAPANHEPIGGNSPRKTRFEIDWTDPASGRTVKLRITHARDYLSSGSDHVEVESLRPKRAPLPITETGYRSHFLPALELMNAGGPVTFVTSWLAREAAGKEWRKRAAAGAQGDLFQWADAQGEVSTKRKRAPRPAPAKRRSRARDRQPE